MEQPRTKDVICLFLRETIALCRQVTSEPLLFRLEAVCYFIIKRSLHREGKEVWLSMVKEHSMNVSSPPRRKNSLYRK